MATNPRKVRFVYSDPVCRNILDSQDWLICEGEIAKTGIFVWRSKTKG